MEKRHVAVIALAVAVRLAFWAYVPVTTDAAIHYTSAKHIAETLSIPLYEHAAGTDPFWYPPLLHILSASLYKITGVITLVPLLSGIGSVIVTYFFLRRHYPELLDYGLLFAALLPFNTYYSGIGYATSLLYLLALATYHLYFTYLDEKRLRHLLGASALAALAGLTHYHGLIVGAAMVMHLALKDWRRAAAVALIVAMLVSPWYIRNTVVFGNPIWPLIFGGTLDHPDWNPDRVGGGIRRAYNPGTYSTLLLDYFIGAPNSGEDFLENVDTAAQRFGEIAYAGLGAWTLCVIILSGLGVAGARKSPSIKHVSFFTIVFAMSLVPAVLNNLARMLVCFAPFLPVLFAKGSLSIKEKQRSILVGAALACICLASLTYANTYHDIIGEYTAFYDLMRQKIPEDAQVVMPYTVHECLYYSGLDCVRIRDFPNSIPEKVYEDPKILKEEGIEYLCCDRLYWDARPERVKSLCEVDREPAFGIEDVGACWQIL